MSLGFGDKYSLIPVTNPDLFRFGKMQEARFWNSSDLVYGPDREDYLRMPRVLKHITDCGFAILLPFDGMLNTCLMTRSISDCTVPAEVYTFALQNAIEAIHAETYGKMAHTIYGQDIDRIRNMANTVPEIYQIGEFMVKYCDKKYSREQNILAQACSEKIHVCTLFLFINLFKKMNIMTTFVHGNSMIREDENLHGKFADYRFLMYGGLPLEENMSIIDEATVLFENLIKYMLREPFEDLTIESYTEYLHLVVDHHLSDLKLPIKYNASDPFSWNIDHCLRTKENLYEVHTGSYSNLSVSDEINKWLVTSDEKAKINIYQDPLSIDF